MDFVYGSVCLLIGCGVGCYVFKNREPEVSYGRVTVDWRGFIVALAFIIAGLMYIIDFYNPASPNI